MEEDMLFPEELEEELDEEQLAEDEESTIGYKIAPYFDMKSGDFIVNGNGQIVTADGVSAYQQWCESVIATDRYNHDCCSDAIGIDYDEIFAASTREEAEAIIESEISEALACDPYGRTQYVQNVLFDWIAPDEVMVTVEVVALDGEVVTVDTAIKTEL